VGIKDSMVYPDHTPVGRYSAIGNDVLDKVADIELTRPQRKVLNRIMQDTLGYDEETKFTGERVRRVTQPMPIERFEEKTGLTREEILPALETLEKRQIIRRNGDTITFNHHLDQWL